MSKRNIIIGIVVICAVVGVLVGIAWVYGLFGNMGTLIGFRSSGPKTANQATTTTATTASNTAAAILSAAEQKKLAEQPKPADGTKITTPTMTAAQRQTLRQYTQPLSQIPFRDQALYESPNPDGRQLVGLWRSLGGYAALWANGTYEVYFGIGGTVNETGSWRITANQLAFNNGTSEYQTPFEYSSTTKATAPYNHWFGFNYRASNGTLVGVGTCGKYADLGEAANFDFYAQTAQCWAAYPGGQWGNPNWDNMATDPVCRHTIAWGYGYNYPACDVYIGQPFSWQ